jgi:cell division protein FtsI/penicillin-binding protein 2
MGKEKLCDWTKEFGFGRKTNVDLPAEESGIIKDPKKMYAIDFATQAFGHGISVTALQLAVAYSALANGGKVMRPNILKRIEDINGNIIFEGNPQILRTISDKKSLDTVKQFLKSVFDYGTARHIKLEAIEMAGKTGTAEKKIFGESGYSKDKYTSVFAGFFPVENPAQQKDIFVNIGNGIRFNVDELIFSMTESFPYLFMKTGKKDNIGLHLFYPV